MRDKLIYIAVFASGMTTLAVEISASRLLGNVFGTTNIVWANIIGLILLYLTAGYFLGGRWADRSPRSATYFRILTWGAFTGGLIPIVSRPVLHRAVLAVENFDAVIMAGSFLSVLILFSVPVTLLGCVSPFAIRLLIKDTANAGEISGKVYAISTIGSIIGTFLPVLWLIPTIGTARTFLVFSLVLQVVGLFGIVRAGNWKSILSYIWMPVLLLILAVITFPGPIKRTEGAIFETESSYNYIQVEQIGSTRILLLNEGQAEHSIYDVETENPPYGYGTWEYFLAAPFFNPDPTNPSDIHRIGVVGLAAGTVSKQFTQVFGPVVIDGWEIDPKIVEVGVEYFNMVEGNLNPIIADGRWGLRNSPHRYDVIVVDAYRPPYIPWQLTTYEFFKEVKDHLTDVGALAINVGRTPTDRRLIEALVGTISAVFPSVYVVDVEGSFNSIVYATVQHSDVLDLVENTFLIESTNGSPILKDILTRTFLNLQPTPESSIIFTDDLAPVESLVNSIVLQYVLSGADGLR